MEPSEGRKKRRRRVVLVPYPFQGHVTPMLHLGSILDERGFSVSIAHTNFNSPNPSSYPNFAFLPLSDNLEGYDTSFYNLLNVMPVMVKNCECSFQEHMVRMLEEGEEVACVIYDNIMRFVDSVANRLDVPSIVLRTTTAAYMNSHVALFQLAEEKRLPLPGTDQLSCFPNRVVSHELSC